MRVWNVQSPLLEEQKSQLIFIYSIYGIYELFTLTYDQCMTAKVQYRRLTPKQRSEHICLLLCAMRSCGLTTRGQLLLSDLLTKSEITMLARRIQIAKRLLSGQSIDSIRHELRVGIRTITAVEYWLHSNPAVHRFVISVPG